MFGLSASHLIILGVILLIFGGRRLPELGAGLGKGLRAFKSALEGLDDDKTTPKRMENQPPKQVARHEEAGNDTNRT